VATDRISDLISASSGLVGVVVGGVITLFINRSIQDHQFAQQRRSDLDGARVAATLEVDRFTSFRSELQVLAKHPDGATIPRSTASSLDTHGLALLLTHLDAAQIDGYQHGNLCMRLFAAGYPRHVSADVADAYHALVLQTEGCLERSIASLIPLAHGGARG